MALDMPINLCIATSFDDLWSSLRRIHFDFHFLRRCLPDSSNIERSMRDSYGSSALRRLSSHNR